VKKPVLIDNWKKAHRFASVQFALGGVLFWSALGGLWILWPVFAEKIPIVLYVGGGLALSIAVGIGRYFKRPGAN
jgi:hypothetical protein